MEDRKEAVSLTMKREIRTSFGSYVNRRVSSGRASASASWKVLPFPVGGDLVDHHPGVFGADVEGGLDPLGELLDGQIEEITVQFGIEDAVAALVSGTPDQQLVIVDMHGDVLGDVLQRLGPAQGQVLTLGLLHRLGEVFGALDIDFGAHHLEALHDAEDPFPALFVFGPLARHFFLEPGFLGG